MAPHPSQGQSWWMELQNITVRSVRFECIALGLVVFLLVRRSSKGWGIPEIIALGATVLSVLVFAQTKQAESDDFNDDTQDELNQIDPDQKYVYLVKDVHFIKLLYSIADFSAYNALIYQSTLSLIDQLLHIRADFDTGVLLHPSVHFEHARDKAFALQNMAASFIHTLPRDEVTKVRYQTFLSRLRILTFRQLDAMLIVAKEEPVSVFKIYNKPLDRLGSLDLENDDPADVYLP